MWPDAALSRYGLERIGVVRLLPEPRPFSHQISPNADLTRRTSVPVARPEEVELLDPLPQQEGIISDTGHSTKEVIPLSSLNQPKAPPSAPIFKPSHPSDTAPDPAILLPSRPLGCDRVAPPPLRRSKRKRFPLS